MPPPDRLSEGREPRIPLAAILTGGRAKRMGVDKSTVPLAGEVLLARVWKRVAPAAQRVIAVGQGSTRPEVPLAVVPDRYPGADSMGGIATALVYATERFGRAGWVLVLACDMPFVEPALLDHLFEIRGGHDIVVPRTEAGYEPLCALYRGTCLPVFQERLAQGNLRIRDVFPRVRTREVSAADCRRYDPELLSFVNINRPEDLQRARDLLLHGAGARAV